MAVAEPDSEPENPPPRRRAARGRRATSQATRGETVAIRKKARRAGKSLRNMLEMPLDVVYEVDATHLVVNRPTAH